jgi:hypothetical protein
VEEEMLVDLTKEDLISIVKGREPSYEQMDHPICKDTGFFSGSYGTWVWMAGLSDYTEQELWDFYKYLKNPIKSKLDQEKEALVYELWGTYNKGFDTKNQLMMNAAMKELKRIGMWRVE